MYQNLLFSVCCSTDATASSGYGRMVNDAKYSNCKMKVMLEGRPHLCLFASAEIRSGDQLRSVLVISCFTTTATTSVDFSRETK